MLFLTKLTPIFSSSWRKELSGITDTNKLVMGYTKLTKLIPSEKWRETQFKILHRTYSAFFRPSNSPWTTTATSKCPKCHSLKPSLVHCLWSCPQIATFWIQANAYINRIQHMTTTMDPLLYLFDVTSNPSSRAELKPRLISRWIHLCLLTAKRCLLKFWIHSHPPNITNLITDLKHLFSLEKRDAELSSPKRNSAFFKCWDLFTFKTTELKELTSTFTYRHWQMLWLCNNGVYPHHETFILHLNDQPHHSQVQGLMTTTFKNDVYDIRHRNENKSTLFKFGQTFLCHFVPFSLYIPSLILVIFGAE